MDPKRRLILLNVSCYLLLCGCYAMLTFAQPQSGPTLGDVSRNILEPASVLADLAYKMCYVLGIALLVGAAIQYRMHRMNPLQVRLSQVFFLIAFGLALIAIPLAARFSIASEALRIF